MFTHVVEGETRAEAGGTDHRLRTAAGPSSPTASASALYPEVERTPPLKGATSSSLPLDPPLVQSRTSPFRVEDAVGSKHLLAGSAKGLVLGDQQPVP